MRREPTPGPWFYVYGAVWTTPNGPDDGGVCVATRASAAPIEPTAKDANMALCSMAPEMRDALQAITKQASAMNARQHAGVALSTADWSDLHDAQNKARAVLTELEARL